MVLDVPISDGIVIANTYADIPMSAKILKNELQI